MPDQGAVRTASDLPRMLAGLMNCPVVVSLKVANAILLQSRKMVINHGLYRQGIKIGTILQAPGSALVNKTKHDIWIVCVKQGYQQATYFNHSGIAGGTFGNIVLGGGIGWAIDSASGADNQYDSPVNLTLVPDQAAPAAPPHLPATFSGTAAPN